MGGCPFKSIYPEKISQVEENICAWWKHNLKPMLQIIRDAKEKHLLMVPRPSEQNGR
jgi:RPA family protein